MTDPVLLSWLLSLVTLAIGLLFMYVVIRFAVLHAMKAHSIWATNTNVDAGRAKLAAKAAAEEAAHRSMWAYQDQERKPADPG